MKNQICTLACLLVLGCTVTMQAQEKKDAVPAEAAKLNKFIGKWVGPATITDDKNQSVKITSTMVFQSVAGGYGIYGTESSDDPKMGKFRGSDLMGYDPYDKKIHCYTVDNTGICHDHICSWKSPDKFHMEHQSTRDGKAFKEEVDIFFKDRNTTEYSIISSLDGKVIETVKGDQKRAK